MSIACSKALRVSSLERPRSASAIGLWRGSWMNAGADYGLRRRRAWQAGVGSRRRRGRRGWRRTRSAGAYGSLRRGSGSSRGARRSRRPIQHCVRTGSGWWIPRAAATRSRPCGGRPRVCGACAMSCAPGVIGSRTRPWRGCCGGSATACRRTARYVRAPRTPTATPSSNTSTPPPRGRWMLLSR